VVAQAQADAASPSDKALPAVSDAEMEETAKKMKIGSYFLLWWTLNVVFNIYNKKVLNAYPYPWLTSSLLPGSRRRNHVYPVAHQDRRDSRNTDLDFWKGLLPVSTSLPRPMSGLLVC